MSGQQLNAARIRGPREASPHCRALKNCAAKGPGHCRSCARAATLRRVHADPVLRGKKMAASAAACGTPANRAKLSEIGKARMADPAARAAIAQAVSRLWADPEYASRAATVRNTETYRARQAENARRAWADPEVTGRRVSAIKAAMSDPEVRERISQARKATMSDPEVRKRMSQAAKANQARPEVRAKISATRAANIERRARARQLVLAAGVRPWKRTVDRALDLLSSGAPPAAIAATLRMEARGA